MRKFEPSAFARSLLGQMRHERARTGDGSAAPLWDEWTDGLYPQLRDAAPGIADEDGVRLHEAIRALNSSMAFAFNLFLPFRLGDSAILASALATSLGRALTVERVVFEYMGPSGVLAEIAGEQPDKREKFTASDVAVLVRDSDARKGVVLIEVKLTEESFTPCGGAKSRGNQRTDVCASANLFFADPSACYLTRTVRAKRDRRYWPIFAEAHGSVREAFPGIEGGECPFRTNRQQPMRNHALALGLVEAGEVEFAAFGLVHHDNNPDIPGPWDEYASVTADRNLLFRLPAARLLDLADEGDERLQAWSRWMRARYRLRRTP